MALTSTWSDVWNRKKSAYTSMSAYLNIRNSTSSWLKLGSSWLLYLLSASNRHDAVNLCQGSIPWMPWSTPLGTMASSVPGRKPQTLQSFANDFRGLEFCFLLFLIDLFHSHRTQCNGQTFFPRFSEHNGESVAAGRSLLVPGGDWRGQMALDKEQCPPYSFTGSLARRAL